MKKNILLLAMIALISLMFTSCPQKTDVNETKHEEKPWFGPDCVKGKTYKLATGNSTMPTVDAVFSADGLKISFWKFTDIALNYQKDGTATGNVDNLLGKAEITITPEKKSPYFILSCKAKVGILDQTFKYRIDYKDTKTEYQAF